MRKKRSAEERNRIRKNFVTLRIVVFFVALAVFAVIGLLYPLRPTQSDLEKRTLETFPAFTAASFWDGDYFDTLSIWYSDTYPFREKLLTADAAFENLYGLKGEQIYISGESAAEEAVTEETSENTLEDALTTGETIEGTVSEPESSGETQTEDLFGEDYVDAAIDVEPEKLGSVYVSGDTGFVLFYDNYPAADNYITMLNKMQSDLSGTANVYSVLAPVDSGIDLSEKIQEKLGLGDQKAFIEYIADGTDDSVNVIQTFDLLKAHNSEYLYFRTDHHWTALGAYYAYTAFCNAKGITPTPLDEFETVEFPDFLGTLYSGSNQAAALKNNPDTVVAYIPQATNAMTFWSADYGMVDWEVIHDVSTYRSSEKYAAFVAGDPAFAQIDNPDLHDGSACLLIKDSYGNAFAPFLVDHYEHVYLVDYRYFANYPDYNGSLYSLIDDKGITDVILLNNTEFVLDSEIDMINAILH